ncbi:MAG: thrombospondin type-1 domain-containing protein, partial [Gammaproteobacteria bacterium]
PCTETVPGFAAGYFVGPWGACSESCGGGVRRRTVYPNLWSPTPPDASRPSESQACNTQRCALTCYDYPSTFPRKAECHAAGFAVCERRFRSDGLGGTLTCYKGF